MLFDFLTLHSLGLCAWSAHIPPASGTHGNHLWHFLKYNENTIIFETLIIVRENLTFLPRQQVDQRNCDSITGNQGIPDNKIVTDLCTTSLKVTVDTDVMMMLRMRNLQSWRFPKSKRLDGVDVVSVVACDPGKACLPHLWHEKETIEYNGKGIHLLSVGIYYLTIHWKLWYKDVDGLKITGTKLTPT